ncbi:hypothetical protein SCP_0306150 [Sparassis crispa]|uniref:TEA domain-containing protein n=1 Tax=Sparassis crispa TaxID=139825 RepID=A0A401GFB9_9APHY|nr:hypothetical protein SCP_0306150 [Sparassis crispa]GBE80894.1 hypothetical protein SCP_0306150 [Sparassis crispa]
MSAARQFAQHVRVSSTDELSYSSSSKDEINDTIQTIVTGRKCWKTMKGKGEVVWPPYLEAALVEGLEKYQPVESRTARAFGRFPMRNKFISDYIFNSTGKRRTPKQVGSRLQQLRDTAEGKRILQLLSSRHIAMMHPSKAESPKDVAPNNSASDLPGNTPSSTAPSPPPCSYVSIDVIPDNGLQQPASLTPLTSYGAGPSSSTSPSPSSTPRTLRSIDPTVTFMSRTPLTAYSSFRVLQNDRRVHEERTELELCSSSCMPAPVWGAPMECTFLYKTLFVPQFWQRLCDCNDPTSYTIVQEIVRSCNPSQSAQTPVEEVLLSVVYQFNSPASTPPLSPQASSFGDADPSPFSAESSPEVGSEFDELLMYGALESPATVQTASSGHGGFASIAGTPQLLHRDDEGYVSLPPSPLNLNSPSDWKFAGAPAAGIAQDPAHAALCGVGTYPPFPAAPNCFDAAPLQHYSYDAYAAV